MPEITPNLPPASITGFKQLEQAHAGPSPRMADARAELKDMVKTCRAFVMAFAADGEGRSAALSGLDLFEQGKVNKAIPDKLTLGLNRQYLSEFIKLLHQQDVPMKVRAGSAVDLFRSLGCCPEGENLRLEESIRELKHYGQGLGKRFSDLKESHINQVLQKLVHQEYADWQPNYDKLEIHHINALKNQNASAWGLSYKADRHSRVSVQIQTGDMARELVSKTVTDASVFQMLMGQVRDTCLSCLGAPDTPTGDAYCYDRIKIDTLASELQGAFGHDIQLHNVLDFAEDHSSFSLKPDTALGAEVLGRLQDQGHLNIHQATSGASDKTIAVAALLAEKTQNVDAVLGQMNQRMKSQGQISPAHKAALNHIANQGLMGYWPTHLDDAKRKKRKDVPGS